jgi:hypothetical protein
MVHQTPPDLGEMGYAKSFYQVLLFKSRLHIRIPRASGKARALCGRTVLRHALPCIDA